MWVRPSIGRRHHVLGVMVVVWVRPHMRRSRVIHGGGSTTTLRRGGWVRRVRVNGLGTWCDQVGCDAIGGTQTVEWRGGAGGGNSEWAGINGCAG